MRPRDAMALQAIVHIDLQKLSFLFAFVMFVFFYTHFFKTELCRRGKTAKLQRVRLLIDIWFLSTSFISPFEFWSRASEHGSSHINFPACQPKPVEALLLANGWAPKGFRHCIVSCVKCTLRVLMLQNPQCGKQRRLHFPDHCNFPCILLVTSTCSLEKVLIRMETAKYELNMLYRVSKYPWIYTFAICKDCFIARSALPCIQHHRSLHRKDCHCDLDPESILKPIGIYNDFSCQVSILSKSRSIDSNKSIDTCTSNSSSWGQVKVIVVYAICACFAKNTDSLS